MKDCIYEKIHISLQQDYLYFILSEIKANFFMYERIIFILTVTVMKI